MIGLKDFLEYKSVSNVQFSPDGQHVGFVLQQPDLESNSYMSSVWVYNKTQGGCWQLTTGNKVSRYIWLDGQTILFLGPKPAGKEQSHEPWTSMHTVNINTCNTQEFCQVPLTIRDFRRMDGSKFAIIADYNCRLPDIHSLGSEEEDQELENIVNSKSYDIIDEIPIWADGVGFISKLRSRLYIYDRDTGAVEAITDEFTQVDSIIVKDSKILIVSKRYTDRRNVPGIYLYDLATDETQVMLAEDRYNVFYADILADAVVFIGSEAGKAIATDNPKFYKLINGDVTLWADTDFSVRDTVGYDCGYGSNQGFQVANDYLYFVSTHERSSFLKRTDVDGNMDTLTSVEGAVQGFDIYDDEVVFTGIRGMGLQELYLLKDKRESALTWFNADALLNKQVSPAEPMVFENSGFNVQYVVLKPTDFDERKKYPALLYIHGGAKVIYGPVFFHEMQVLASKGYFVIYGNPRGSDGQGSEFARLQGIYGQPDYADLMKAVDVAIERYSQIDVNRLGVMGGSYGGIMTNWIIGHTDRFKCAVAERSICNMVSAFGTADNGFNFVREQMDADPWSDLNKLWEQSPLKYANNVKTPLLLIHSDQDHRCHYTEAIQMFTALKYHGVESRICLIKGENHDLSRRGRPRQRIIRLNEITNWLDKHLV